MDLENRMKQYKLGDDVLQLITDYFNTWTEVSEFLEQNAPDVYENYVTRIDKALEHVNRSDWTVNVPLFDEDKLNKMNKLESLAVQIEEFFSAFSQRYE